MSELRCAAKKHAEVVDDHTVEVRCRSVFCGHVPGQVVVIHTFDLHHPEDVQTRRFKEIRRK